MDQLGIKALRPGPSGDEKAPNHANYDESLANPYPNLPDATWTVTIADREFVGFTPVIAKELVGHVDNSAYPLIDVHIAMTLVVPANAKGPVPVLMMFGRTGLPSPAQPPSLDLISSTWR